MLEMELKKEIMKLSKNYSFNEIDSSISGQKLLVSYKGNTVLRIYNNLQYRVEITIERPDFYRLPFSNKLWMLAAEFAMTPVDKRFKEDKYTVVIVNNSNNEYEDYPIEAWTRNFLGFSTDIYNSKNMLKGDLNAYFTEEEYKELIKYIKTLPDGEFQAKVAEHGKTLIEEDDKL
ncbi:hypothetical protein [Levilactobacillus phage ENFP1]|nr:hypothetical protein [Levilactobacillus phage ENFP1]